MEGEVVADLISTLFNPQAGQVSPTSNSGWSGGAAYSYPTTAGVNITPETAMTYAAVWEAVRVITETVAMLPWHSMRRLPNGDREHQTGPVDVLLHNRPNPLMSSFSWRQSMLAWVLLWGNGYAEIVRDGRGNPAEMWLIASDRVTPEMQDDGTLVYEVKNPNGDPARLDSRDMFHLHGLGFDGISGLSVIAYAAKSIGLGIASEEFGAAFFGNGAQLGAVITNPGVTRPENDQQIVNLKKTFNRVHQGAAKAHKVEYLEGGMDYKTIGIPPEQAQFLETRQHQVTEVARWFRLPPHKLADLTNATYSNIEEQETAFTRDAILPWVRPFEQEADYKLLGDTRGNRFTRMNLNMLMRGDSEKRALFYESRQRNGSMSVNDVRRLEDENSIGPEGDQYIVQSNMIPLKDVGKNFDAVEEPDQAFAGAMARILSREGQRGADARAHSTTAREFRGRIDRFYREHENYMTKALTEAVADLPFDGEVAQVEIGLFIDAHVGESKRLHTAAFADGKAVWCDEIARATAAAADLLDRIKESTAVAGRTKDET